MNKAMFLQTMLEVLKYDSKFKDKKSVLLPILRRAKINNLPQWEFVRGGRSGQRYENVELRVPVPLLDEANVAFDNLYELIESMCMRKAMITDWAAFLFVRRF